MIPPEVLLRKLVSEDHHLISWQRRIDKDNRKAHWEKITGPGSGGRAYGRRQKFVSSIPESLEWNLHRLLDDEFPLWRGILTITKIAILQSMPGTGMQDFHLDRPIEDNELHYKQTSCLYHSMSAILSFADDVFLYMCPSGDLSDDSNVMKVYIPAGHILFFKTDMLHAGMPYQDGGSESYYWNRLHFQIDAYLNTTQFQHDGDVQLVCIEQEKYCRSVQGLVINEGLADVTAEDTSESVDHEVPLSNKLYKPEKPITPEEILDLPDTAITPETMGLFDIEGVCDFLLS